VICCCENKVAEAGDSSGTHMKGMSAVGSHYQARASENCNKVTYSDL
jgi:hypothetical protein